MRDTAIERKNHEASAKHQNNIQRSLRELHKGKEREEREKQRAKDEVNRLNGLVSGQKPTAAQPGSPSQNVGKTGKPAPAPQPPQSTAQQRKAHAEQLAALGVELPEELKKEKNKEMKKREEKFDLTKSSMRTRLIRAQPAQSR